MRRIFNWRPLKISADQAEYIGLILLAVTVGILGALGNIGFRYLIQISDRIFRTLEWNLLGIGRGGWYLALIPVVLMSGGVVLLALDYFFPGDVLGYGFPNFLEMVNLGTARIKKRWIVVKAAGTAVSLGAGASVGREGPIAQIGGAIGSAVAQLARVSIGRRRVLVACGAGAGIATTFNAPIGGLMFAQEIVLLGEAEISSLSLLIVSTTSGVVMSRAILGNAAVFAVQPFVFQSYAELVSYAVLGVVLGVLGAAYIRLFHAVGRFFRRWTWPPAAKLLIGLAIVGAIAIPLPQNLSDGYPIIDHAFRGEVPLVPRIALIFAKMVASSISLGAGAPGGVFGPIFFIGTMAGGSFRSLSDAILPTLTGPRGSYALIGLGGFLAAVTHAPLTALFLLFEMTQSYEVTLPSMITTITALVVARMIESESIDTYALARQGKSLQIGRDRQVLTQMAVGSVMNRNITLVSEASPLSDVLRVAGETAQTTLPVVDSDGMLRGVIIMHDLLGLMASGRDLGPLVNAHDICRNGPMMTVESTLDEALQAMNYEGLEEIPVVDATDANRLHGIVTRHSIAQALNRAKISLSTLSTRDDASIFWSTGYRVVRMSVPASAVGATLRTLEPGARFHVSVLAVLDSRDPDAGFVPGDADRLLKPGDIIVAAGRAEAIRRFQSSMESYSAQARAGEAPTRRASSSSGT
jgi:CIC family chloride channel protein